MNRLPIAALRPFVALLWSTEGRPPESFAVPKREHVLPTGMTHLVFRLSDSPLRLFANADDRLGQSIGDASVGGARSRFHVREMGAPSSSVGAVLRPGAALLLLDAPADEVAGRHTPLEQFWGDAARDVHGRLQELPTAEARLDCLESLLVARLPKVRGMHPAVAHVIDRMHAFPSVDAAVRCSGFSHRHFIEQFRRSVGLPPKTYLRILRFQQALRSVERRGPRAWSWVAMEAGYSDQSHFNRDFLEFTGVTPTVYEALRPVEPNHLQMPEPGQFHPRLGSTGA